MNNPTLTIANRSMRWYPPPRSIASVMARHTPTHAFTDSGASMFSTCATPPYMPPTCISVEATVSAQAHTSQFTPARGPGTRLNPSSPV